MERKTSCTRQDTWPIIRILLSLMDRVCKRSLYDSNIHIYTRNKSDSLTFVEYLILQDLNYGFDDPSTMDCKVGVRSIEEPNKGKIKKAKVHAVTYSHDLIGTIFKYGFKILVSERKKFYLMKIALIYFL